MSLLDSLFGSSGTTQQTASQLTPLASNAAQTLFTKAQGGATAEYGAYPNQRIAGFNPNETDAFTRSAQVGDDSRSIFSSLWDRMAQDAYRDNAGGIRSLGAQGRDLAERGAGATTDLATLFPDADIQRYMNPYVQQVLDPAMRDLERQAATQKRSVDDRAIMTGSFGGSRNAIAQGVQDRNLLEETGRLSANERARAFGAASNEFRLDQANIPELYNKAIQQTLMGQQGLANVENSQQQQYNQLSNLFNLNQSRYASEVNPLLAVGGAQREMDQANMDLAYQNYIEQRDWWKNGLPELQATLGLSPAITTTGTRTTQQGAEPNRIGQALGAGIGAVGLANQLGGLFGGSSNFLSGIFGGGAAADGIKNITADAGGFLF
jgi:hypothetical protein